MQSVGRPVSRVEGTDKVTGRACYSADTPVEGVTFAALVQSEIPHGRVTAASMASAASRAAAAPGVLYVLTPLNCPALHVLPEDLTWDLPLERRPPLSDLSVQHVGQHLALVDDVLTTGATAETLARLLLKAGAARVEVYCLARTPSPGD